MKRSGSPLTKEKIKKHDSDTLTKKYQILNSILLFHSKMQQKEMATNNG